ncbi:MAG: epoxyqueuosine reductase [Desulfobulbaceae bacterium]|uniref:Epoxyqueuosine reductase n=1 Tax=Candidatus Desulfatifera sulfidica TaxID=2841691 RepID=A0A8J6TCY4_9BACT|nr:epoxyqueuosine reductase [Candidatus Desulfatifera sulfidica]
MDIAKQLVGIAIRNGASLAGIADMETIKNSPSHLIYTKLGRYEGKATVKSDHNLPDSQLFNWPDSAKSALVIGLSHPESHPELDWWWQGGTPGNRLLIDIMNRSQQQIENDLKINTVKIHYYVEQGGLFLKDAAVLSGLGCIGKNNMLVTPQYGPRVRLRALLLKAELEPTGPVNFDPCSGCKEYCRKICPEKAMAKKTPLFDCIDCSTDLPARDGKYNRENCNERMDKDILATTNSPSTKQNPVKFCRKCELICPVAKNSRKQ